MKRILFALALLAAATSASAQETIPLQKGPYTHQASSMSFPLTVGPFRRLRTLTRYAPDGSDESIGYNWETESGRVAATVYVYPSPSLATASTSSGTVDDARAQLCSAQFSGVEYELASVHPSARIESNDAAVLTQGDIRYTGHALTFTVTSPSIFGQSHPPLRSEAYLFCYVGGRWSVKYRFTYPAAIDIHDEITAFMRDLVWTIAPEQL